MRVGVEVGGTFTDLVAIKDGNVQVAKVPSVPARPDEGAMASLAAGQVDLSAVEELVHGSTVATNAILERKGARVALLIQEGFAICYSCNGITVLGYTISSIKSPSRCWLVEIL